MAAKTILGARVVEECGLPGQSGVAQAAHARVMNRRHDFGMTVRTYMRGAPVVAVCVAVSANGGGMFAV